LRFAAVACVTVTEVGGVRVVMVAAGRITGIDTAASCCPIVTALPPNCEMLSAQGTVPWVTEPPEPPPPPPPVPVGRPEPPVMLTVVVEVEVMQVNCVAAPTVKANQPPPGERYWELVVADAPSAQ
jgi:hypothetical protein